LEKKISRGLENRANCSGGASIAKPRQGVGGPQNRSREKNGKTSTAKCWLVARDEQNPVKIATADTQGPIAIRRG